MMQSVEMVEVGPRDGLQNEKAIITTDDKVALINRAIAAGSRRIEVASFVHPGLVPQMADAEDVVARLPHVDDVTYIGLCLNKRGVMRALATRDNGGVNNNKMGGIHEVGCVAVASNSFGQRNQGQTIKQALNENCDMIRFAHAEGLRAQVTIATAFGCPFEGAVSADTVLGIASELANAGPIEIALADTIGVAVPAQVEQLFGSLREILPENIRMRAHFHDTRGTGMANIWAAIGAGVSAVDTSLGGLGGCPFAPGAAGNVASEDAVYMLSRSGIETGLDLEKLLDVSAWLQGVMGKVLPSKLAIAGDFKIGGHRHDSC